MQDAHPAIEASAEERKIAERFVEARLQGRTIAEYPGPMPVDRAAAYRIQDMAIALWPEPIDGWKTTMVIPPQYGSDFVGHRLIGPAFRSAVRNAAPGEVLDIPLIDGGFSGLEPEILVRVGRDAPADKLAWTIEEAIGIVGEVCIGAEVVTSPLPGLGMISLPVMASDFGANFGAVAGAPILDWRTRQSVAAEVHIDGEFVASGTMPMVEGVLDAFAFALGECARRGYPLRAGALITTGTLTAYHEIQPGHSARFFYPGHGELAFRTVAAQARSAGS